MDNLFLSIFACILLLFFGLIAAFYKHKSKVLREENSKLLTQILSLKDVNSSQRNSINNMYIENSKLNSIIETQKEHIQALRRAERRHKYLIKKLNPKNGKKASLQDTKSN